MAGRKKRDQSGLTFVTESQFHAKRKPDEEWEAVKDVIVGYYWDDKHTLDELMPYMETHHNFKATKRQYIHRLEKWGIRKYNKDKEKADDDHDEHNQGDSAPHTPSPRRKTSRQPRASTKSTVAGSSQQALPDQRAPVAAPQGQDPDPYDDPSQAIDPYLLNLGNPNAHFGYSFFASSHSAFGDSQSAFQIQAALYRQYPEVSLAVTCARSAQTKNQVNDVRIIVEEAINGSEANENSWDRFLFGALLARNWEQAGDRDNALEQFGDLLDDLIHLSNSQFKHQLALRARSPGNLPYDFDIIAYIYLRHAVLSFNKDDLNIDEGLWLDVDEILRQFRNQQPISNGVRLSCLEDCLDWCVTNLEKNNTLLEKREPLPINLGTTPGDYKVVCLLWTNLVQGLQQPHLPQWSMQAEEQLSIPAPELLVHVVCTIMATPLPNMGARFDSVVGDALFRARILKEASPEDLLKRFLIQVEKTADQRMATGKHMAVSVKASDFDAVREVFSRWMPEGYTLPSRHQEYIHPLIVRDQNETKAAVPTPSITFSPTPSLSSYSPFASAQYGVGFGSI